VPRLENLLGYASGEKGWLMVPNITKPEQYSSLIGAPVAGLSASNSNLTADFSLETSYISLLCAAWERFAEHDQQLKKYKNQWEKSGSIPWRKR
jgi:hypothetical protein